MSTHVYCPRCGSRMERRLTEGRERDVCPTCDYVFYRNPVPAVGVVVALNGRVVLVQRKFEPRAGFWGLPAGYMELGESAEEAAIRECYEETGLLVQVDHLLGVYSFGDASQSGLIIIYTASAVGGQLQAGDDATDAQAFPLDLLPMPLAFRTHLQAIERWRSQQRTPVPQQHLDLEESGVRFATQDDLPAALTLLMEQNEADSERQVIADALLSDWLHSPDHAVLVAQWEDAIAGVAVVSLHQTLRGWHVTPDDLVVVPIHRRRGLGIALVEAAARLAQERGCSALHYIRSTTHDATFLLARGFAGDHVLSRPLED